MTELATIRWGDQQDFAIPANAGAITLATKQLVAAVWQVPMSWNVILVAFPQLDASETATFTVLWNFVLGGGGSTMGPMPLFTTTLAPAAGVYSLQQTQQLVPSQALQISATIKATTTATKPQGLSVGAFVSPNNAEPFAEIDAARMAHDAATRDRWMREGFQPEQLYYQDLRRPR